MPGVLQLEAIAQIAGLLMLKQAQNIGQIAYFMAAENVRWRKPVVPGDQLVIEVELTRARGKIATCGANRHALCHAGRRDDREAACGGA